MWHAYHPLTRTTQNSVMTFTSKRPDIPKIRPSSKVYRNPLIFAMELNDELVRDNLTRKQLAQRHEISSDRVTQWLCLLKLPLEEQERIRALGDNWKRSIVTERYLRTLR